MTIVDTRAASATRTPREPFKDDVEIGVALEGDTPPLALLQCEVEVIVGRPPQDLASGDGFKPGFTGCQHYQRGHALRYRRDDGTMLVYEYEGARAYALAEVHS